MNLGRVGNELKYIKKDGSVSIRAVSVLAMLEHAGFNPPTGSGGGVCTSAKLRHGDILQDSRVIVTASGNSWFGNFILSNETGEYVELRDAEIDDIWQAMKGGQPIASIEHLVNQLRAAKRKRVNVAELSQRRGIEVWGNGSHFWSPGIGEFDDLPEGWDFVPSGDAPLTRRVRSEAHWVAKQKNGKFSVDLGTYAPRDSINAAFDALGGDTGAARRSLAKAKSLQEREVRMTQAFRDAIRSLYPSMPLTAVEETVARARGGGVGRAAFVYFSTRKSDSPQVQFAARLAVRAHIRHKCTRYDDLLSNGVEREEARLQVACKRDHVERHWQSKWN